MIDLSKDGWQSLVVNDAAVKVLVRDGNPVRVSAISLADDSGEVVIQEAPEDDAIEAAIEDATGRWVKVGEWDVANEGIDGEVVADLEGMNDQPTHRITFTGIKGDVYVKLVALQDVDDEDGNQAAYDRRECRDMEGCSWAIVDGEWLCEGNVTPGGENGTVEITRLHTSS